MLTSMALILFCILALMLNHNEDRDTNKYVFYGTFLIINIILLFRIRNLIADILLVLFTILCIFAFIKISFKNNKLAQRKPVKQKK
jgi:MFS-type transporter involved in bile tolerance (Atg22 family)